MSFGFGVGDIVLVSNGAIKFWSTINNARAEQDDLAKTLELLRELVQRITGCAHIIAPKLSPATTRVIEQQLLFCSRHLRNLDDIVAKYMGYRLSDDGSERKRQNRRLFMWGAYKRDEFVQSLDELRKLVLVLLSYAMFERLENAVPPSPNTSHGCEPLRLIDALDRETVCSIQLCDTWEVCYPCRLVATGC